VGVASKVEVAGDKRPAAAIQDRALADVLYVPLGHYLQKRVWRS